MEHCTPTCELEGGGVRDMSEWDGSKVLLDCECNLYLPHIFLVDPTVIGDVP